MIPPQLNPDSPGACPPPAPVEPFNGSLEHTLPALDEPRLAVVMGTGMDLGTRTGGDGVITGLWHCLLGSLAAGLGISTLLGVLVLILNQIG